MSPEVKSLPPLFRGRIRLIFLPVALALLTIVWRLFVGLGPTTGMNDGYPWGIWIAYDVVAGTALACGGYAVALLCYIFNKGRYHPLVRPAILSSALGYSIAGLSIVVDVGRYWNLWKVVVFPWDWNFNSILLEVALCVMSYVLVLWIEFSPAFLATWSRSRHPLLKAFAERSQRILERSLMWIIALGLLLPTMHQSSLGSLMIVAMDKLNPLWHTPLLPLLFLTSCLAMGYSVVIFETTAYTFSWRLPRKRKLLQGLARVIVGVNFAWILLRLGDLAWRGELAGVMTHGHLSGFFIAEMLLFLVPSVMLAIDSVRRNPGARLLAAIMLMVAGTLYRFDTYLVAYNPGPAWSYFPSAPELMVSLGFVGIEILVFIAFVRLFPVIGNSSPGEDRPESGVIGAA